jgi:hypothetical protein
MVIINHFSKVGTYALERESIRCLGPRRVTLDFVVKAQIGVDAESGLVNIDLDKTANFTSLH